MIDPAKNASAPAAWVAQARLDTPLGPMSLACTGRGWSGAWFDGQAHHPGVLALPFDEAHPHLRSARGWLQAYFQQAEPLPALQARLRWHAHAGGASALVGASNRGLDAGPDAVWLDPLGTAFQQSVWQALLAIAPGGRGQYGQIAQQLGRPQGARAVGGAVGRNPLTIAVPCHRVVGASGALTGYAGGLDRKRWLLAREAQG